MTPIWTNGEGTANTIIVASTARVASQVGIGVGLSQAGLPGALAAWIAFTLPSAIALILFAYWVIEFGDIGSGVLYGLKVVAVAVVAQAVWAMECATGPRYSLRVFA